MNSLRLSLFSALFFLFAFLQVVWVGSITGFIAYPQLPFPNLLGEFGKLILFFGFSILSWVGIYFFLKKTYIDPIRILRTEIAHFLAGVQSPKKLDTKSQNPDISYIGNFFHRSLEILRNFKEEFQSGRVLRSEVELASDIQKHVLKKTHPEIPSFEIIYDTKSATEVGGDTCDIINQGDNSYVYIGDVTGHGVASGFVMIMVNALISGFSKMIENSADILVKTNEILKPRVKSNMLMTLLMVRWNEKQKKLYMTWAGHEYLLIYRQQQNKVFAIKSGGIALGMTRDISKILKEIEIEFEPGDCLVMYTDGITESRNGNKESDLMFGIERLIKLVADAPVKTATGIFKHITIELSRFMGYSYRQFDDITLIVIRYKDHQKVLPETREIAEENITEWNWNA